MVSVTFFRGPGNELLHCHGFTPLPAELANHVPPSATFGVLRLDYGDGYSSAWLRTIAEPPGTLDSRYTELDKPEELLHYYRELDIDTELEVTNG